MGNLRVLGSPAAFIVRRHTNALKMRAVDYYDILVVVHFYHIPRRHILENGNLNLNLWLHYLSQDAEFRCKFPDKGDLRFNLRINFVCTDASVTATRRVS